jgi:hypothetical protein
MIIPLSKVNEPTNSFVGDKITRGIAGIYKSQNHSRGGHEFLGKA